MAQVKIIAIPDPNVKGLEGENLGLDRGWIKNFHAAAGYQAISGYKSIDGLIAKIKAVLEAQPYPCLRVLEVVAHGSPGMCDGIKGNGFGFGFGIRNLENVGGGLCDRMDIYLSGCNTGCTGRGHSISIAELIASILKYEQGTFDKKIVVYGSLGYLAGFNMPIRGYTPKSHRVSTSRGKPAGAPYKGSKDAKGDYCWKPFRKGW